MSSPDVVVYGATGLTGRLACAALDDAGVRFAIGGRDPDRLARIRSEHRATSVRVANADDAAGLAAAFARADVVLNCAGPSQTIGERVLVAALSAGAHYVDVGGAQSYLHDMYVRYESMARRSQRVCMLGAALECALGDLAAAWAAAYVCGNDRPELLGCDAAGVRLGEDAPLDDIAISYVFDHLVLSPAGQRAVFDELHAPGLAWRRDRWEAVAPGSERRRVNAGSTMGYERSVVSFPGGDAITVPRRVATQRVQTFVSTSRRSATTTALRWLARTMPALPKQVTDVLTPYVPTSEEYDRTRFAIVAQARRGATSAHVSVLGSNIYRTSANVAAWVVRQLLARTGGPTGMRTPAELFGPQRALAELALAADLRIETSFG